jgi:hypothetical protein
VNFIVAPRYNAVQLIREKGKAVTFEPRKERVETANISRQREVRRAVLLIKRAGAIPPKDIAERMGLWKLEQAIPDDIKREAYDLMGTDHSVSGAAERVGRRHDLTEDDGDFDHGPIGGKAEAPPATEDTVSLLRDIASQANVIEAMAADLKAAGLEVTEAEVREYLAGVDFDAIVKQVREAPHNVALIMMRLRCGDGPRKLSPPGFRRAGRRSIRPSAR